MALRTQLNAAHAQLNQKIANGRFFDHLKLLGKACFSTATQQNFIKFDGEILQTAGK